MKLFIIPILLTTLHLQSSGQCRNLSFEEGSRRKLISDDLFNTSINSQFLGCPNNVSGDSVLCGQVRYERSSYDIGLPDMLFFTVFLTPRHYDFCKAVFDDPFIRQSLTHVPMPSVAAIAWYDKWKNYTVNLLESDENPYAFEMLDEVQKKMVTVLHAVNSWTFCPKENYGPQGTTHATFDDNNNIVIYRTACKTPDIYEANVSETALVHRLFFVCAHEIVHVIDRKSGVLGTEKRAKSEQRANVNGLVITLAFAKIFNEKLRQDLLIVKHSENKARCDVKYLTAMIKKWSKIEMYLDNKIAIAKRIYNNEQSAAAAFNKNKEWMLWACMTLNKRQDTDE